MSNQLINLSNRLINNKICNQTYLILQGLNFTLIAILHLSLLLRKILPTITTCCIANYLNLLFVKIKIILKLNTLIHKELYRFFCSIILSFTQLQFVINTRVLILQHFKILLNCMKITLQFIFHLLQILFMLFQLVISYFLLLQFFMHLFKLIFVSIFLALIA